MARFSTYPIGGPPMSSIEDTVGAVVVLRLAEYVFRLLAKPSIRSALSDRERLRIAELGRDAMDAIDYGVGTLPVLRDVNPIAGPATPQPEPPPNFDEVRIAVRPLCAVRRPPARPARPRCAAAD
jgi:hypothetical protein